MKTLGATGVFDSKEIEDFVPERIYGEEMAEARRCPELARALESV